MMYEVGKLMFISIPKAHTFAAPIRIYRRHEVRSLQTNNYHHRVCPSPQAHQDIDGKNRWNLYQLQMIPVTSRRRYTGGTWVVDTA